MANSDDDTDELEYKQVRQSILLSHLNPPRMHVHTPIQQLDFNWVSGDREVQRNKKKQSTNTTTKNHEHT